MQAETVQWTDRLLSRLLRNQQILRRRFNAGMAHQDLNSPQIHTVFQQVRGEAMPKQVRVDSSGDARSLPRCVTDPADGGHIEWMARTLG